MEIALDGIHMWSEMPLKYSNLQKSRKAVYHGIIYYLSWKCFSIFLEVINVTKMTHPEKKHSVNEA